MSLRGKSGETLRLRGLFAVCSRVAAIGEGERVDVGSAIVKGVTNEVWVNVVVVCRGDCGSVANARRGAKEMQSVDITSSRPKPFMVKV